MIKVALVFGTRPEVIKLAPVYTELRRREHFVVEALSSGQHRELTAQMLSVFGIEPDADLSLMEPEQSLPTLTARAIVGLAELFEERRPDVVLVQGDTTTVFCAALAAFYHRITIGHVEAGLRTRDKFQPFPEEINRRLTDAMADLHFAATQLSRRNLLAEGVPPERIFVTGNTVADALGMILEHRPSLAGTDLEPIDAWLGRVLLVTAHRRENLGVPMVSICQALRRLHNAFDDLLIVFPVHPNPAVREVVNTVLAQAQRVRIIEPPNYEVFVPLMRRADLILTDSGGIQEEAPSLGVPVLVARNTTERPEGIEAGAAKLVGTDEDTIVAEASKLLSDPRAYHAMASVRNPYGDGQAARRVVDALEFHFGIRDEPPEEFVPGGQPDESRQGR
ncbi:MAG: UDP-N-acetylglucosamine 2-epimerase (non-hydrolyzing) [Armatimonadetes bacterium]|nr:UDP-N-acetylglucosamine 2-epimerase (non-hydrolyzing) [Armatimonadota bacterium]